MIVEECFYHPSHTWARPDSGHEDEGGVLRVGVDDFAAKVLPRVKDAILPQRGGNIRKGHVFCWIVCSSSTLPILAPISGKVVAANPKLGVRPKLINIDPYCEGWLVSVDPSDLERELASLLRGKSAASWMANEQKKFERLTTLLRWPTYPPQVHRSNSEVGVTLADGGERFLELDDAASVRRYFEFITQFFL
jgi:glycine cleavage system H lipoate-binding protein